MDQAASISSDSERFRPIAWLRDHPRGRVSMLAMLMAGLSLIIGLGVVIYDGILNPLARPQQFFIAVGFVAFYIPGMLMAAAAIGLRRGWTRMVMLGSLAALAQGLMALVPTFGHPVVMSFSWVTLIEGLIWTTADFWLAWLLWRSIPWVAADAEAHRGFEVEAVQVES